MRRLLLVLTLSACNSPDPGSGADSSEATSAIETSADGTTGEPSTGEASTAVTTTAAPTTGAATTVDTHDTDDSPVAFTCEPGVTAGDAFVDCVESFTPEGAMFGQDRFPEVVFGPPQAGPGGTGSVDVLSLGCGGEITLYFDAPAIVDGPGADFIVFENPLPVGESTFVEPARVLVSADGLTWHAFPCDPPGEHPPLGCAGIARVYAGPENSIDPTDPATAGGDAFDLAQLGLGEARYVRLLDVGEAYYGARTWCGGGGGGFDLDAIAVVHAGM